MGYIPTSWRKSNVVFIPKAGKDSLSDPKNFRPISLTSFLLKTLEKIILYYFNTSSLNKTIWHKAIYAYRKGIGTETALHHVVGGVERAVNEKKTIICIFMDISSAFSNASVDALVTALENTGIEPGIVNWTKKMLSTKEATAYSAGSAVTKGIERGCPQGSNLSPLLWNLLINDFVMGRDRIRGNFLERREEERVEYSTLADDLLQKIEGKNYRTMLNTIKTELLACAKWARKRGLEFNATKTKAMRFKRGKQPPFFGNLFLGEKKIEWVNTIKYLYIMIDNKLHWNPHLKYLEEKSRKVIFSAKKIVTQKYGAAPICVRWITNNIVRPIISHACVVWVHKVIKHPSKLLKLKQIQRLGLVITAGVSKNTPTVALEAMLQVESLDVYLQTCALQTRRRLINTQKWMSNEGMAGSHAEWLNDLTKNIPYQDMPLDTPGEECLNFADFEIQVEDRALFDQPFVDRDPISLTCWTDGSKDEEGNAGAAYIVASKIKSYCLNKYKNLGKMATVFQC